MWSPLFGEYREFYPSLVAAIAWKAVKFGELACDWLIKRMEPGRDAEFFQIDVKSATVIVELFARSGLVDRAFALLAHPDCDSAMITCFVSHSFAVESTDINVVCSRFDELFQEKPADSKTRRDIVNVIRVFVRTRADFAVLMDYCVENELFFDLDHGHHEEVVEWLALTIMWRIVDGDERCVAVASLREQFDGDDMVDVVAYAVGESTTLPSLADAKASVVLLSALACAWARGAERMAWAIESLGALRTGLDAELEETEVTERSCKMDLHVNVGGADVVMPFEIARKLRGTSATIVMLVHGSGQHAMAGRRGSLKKVLTNWLGGKAVSRAEMEINVPLARKRELFSDTRVLEAIWVAVQARFNAETW